MRSSNWRVGGCTCCWIMICWCDSSHRPWPPPSPPLHLLTLSGPETFSSHLTLKMTAPCQKSWFSSFLCPASFSLSPGWSQDVTERWEHGGVWPCAGLLSVASFTVSLRAGSHFTTMSFPEIRASCRSFVSVKNYRKKILFILECLQLF